MKKSSDIMLKKIVFDLDNTLIMWKDEYYSTLNKSLEYYNIDYNNEVIEKLKEAVDNYENNYEYYNKENMISIMEKYSKIKLPNTFIDTWISYLEKCVPKEDYKLNETLEYLSQKYELVVLTNWFKDEQVKRLENINILKYFKEVIGTENIKNKPNEEAYIEACKPYKCEECMMIGDSLKTDIEGAKKVKMKYLLYDYNNKYDIENKITNLEDLKNIL